MIPKYIWQTWHTTLPVKMQENIRTLKIQHPDFTHAIYDISECRAFIAIHFDYDVVDAYDTLLPYAYKADLWRLCVLYIHGGIYLDVKFRCVDDFRLNMLLDKEYYAADLIAGHISNGLMVCKAGNIQLLNAIKQIVQHVSERYYGETPLHISGPGLLAMLKVDCNIRFDKTCSYFLGITKILDTYAYYHLERSNNYVNAWKEKRVYRQKVLMLVAHPDDETLFGFNDLICASTVVCFTNGSNSVRSAEFYSVMYAVGVKGIMLDYNDAIDDNWSYIDDSEFFDAIPYDDEDCIVSHNMHGEYGHIQHIRVHNIAVALAKKRDIAYRDFQKVHTNDFHKSLLDLYVSQKDSIATFYNYIPLIQIHKKIDSGNTI